MFMYRLNTLTPAHSHTVKEYEYPLQGVVTLVGPIEPFVTGIKMKSRSYLEQIQAIKGCFK